MTLQGCTSLLGGHARGDEVEAEGGHRRLHLVGSGATRPGSEMPLYERSTSAQRPPRNAVSRCSKDDQTCVTGVRSRSQPWPSGAGSTTRVRELPANAADSLRDSSTVT